MLSREHEVLFIDFIARSGESDTLIDGLGCAIFLLHVEPNSTDLGIRLRSSHGVVMYCAVYTAAAPGWRNIHALDPPEEAIAPIAPFICNHQLSEELAVVALFQFCDYEESMRGGFDQGDGPETQAVEIKAAAFCFKSHGCTERRDRRRIFGPGESDVQVVEAWHGVLGRGLGGL
jgi:hypothetical protein